MTSALRARYLLIVAGVGAMMNSISGCGRDSSSRDGKDTTGLQAQVKTADRDSIRGKWKAGGRHPDMTEMVAVTWEIVGDDMIMQQFLDGKSTSLLRGKVSLADAHSPKEITITGLRGTFTDGGREHSFPDVLGIYKLDGDTLKVCYGGPDEPRPSAFGPEAAIPPGTMVFNRMKN
jgi:uncharacterized protein (TIGR03067 family)